VRLDDIALAALQILPTLEWISEQMGHTEIDTTRKHYARWTDATDDRILDALNAERAKETGLKTDSVVEAAK
jgi:integrase